MKTRGRLILTRGCGATHCWRVGAGGWLEGGNTLLSFDVIEPDPGHIFTLATDLHLMDINPDIYSFWLCVTLYCNKFNIDLSFP